MADYHIRLCVYAGCGLRYPAPAEDDAAALCPHCGRPTQWVPVQRPAPGPRMMPAGLPHVEVLLDNIRSLYNVGALLRTADGVGVRHMHLCGISATPDHPQLAKTALGAGAQMRWSYAVDAVQRARQLKASGYVLWALEDTAEAHSIFVARAPLDRPLVVVVGNERLGVDPELLALCDAVWVIPMYGLKDSLNVAVAFGVAIYQIMHAR